MAKPKTIRGWHFLPDDGRLRWGSREVVEVGKTYTAAGPLKMCRNGMHASRLAIDALVYAPGPIVCRVELAGEIREEDDKCVARSRRVLSIADATAALHEFGCCCAEAALLIADVDDVPSSCAIEAKRAWVRGEITADELKLARASAWESARASAWASAWASARESAWESAWASAWESARASAWESARASAWESARASARAEQNDLLESMLGGWVAEEFQRGA